MSVNRHSFVAFYPSDWVGGTFRLPRLVKSVYFDVCLYNWDKAETMPATELDMMLMDLDPGQGDKIIDVLVRSGKLERDDKGNVWSPRAMSEATKAYTLWEQKSQGGKRAAISRARKQSGEESGQDSVTERATPTEPKPEPSPEPSVRGGTPPLAGEPKTEAKPDEEKPDAGKGGKPDEDEPEKPKRISAGACAEVFGAWNEAAKPLGLSVATKMTGSREGSIRARIEELGNERITEALGMLGECQFLLGSNDRKWKADIDFFLRPNSIPRILEGKYRTAGGGASAWRDME